MPLVSSLGRCRQKDHKFKVIFHYMSHLRTLWATQDPQNFGFEKISFLLTKIHHEWLEKMTQQLLALATSACLK